MDSSPKSPTPQSPTPLSPLSPISPLSKLSYINKVVDFIFSYYEKFGNKDYIGEPVSQTEHMVQAAMMAERDGKCKKTILAALFHDIGHLIGFDEETPFESMDDLGVKYHEKLGAVFLRKLNIPYPIPDLVEGHVQAKRYLTFKNPDYYNKLSKASKGPLQHQGGPMNESEAFAFESNKLFKDMINLRNYDEKAKETNILIKDLNYYKEMLRDVLKQN